jgi:transcriptional regulator of aroF, aroG, tyrA and aromatic amino acid transport
MGANVQNIAPNALTALIEYDWPGNIRELSNTIERAILFCDEESIDIQHLPSELTEKVQSPSNNS